ncbi:hypothetical protein [Azospirillum sp. ST 5-10]|uniref:hypothetical protein n=1 Tax=unclassified Azospirillum TaxID=2630922 RepID=UPI003F4A4881
MTATVLPFRTAVRTAAPPTAVPAVEITRRPFGRAADWQRTIVAECRRHRTPDRQLVAFLKETGLLACCTFLAGGPGEALTFRFIGAPTIAALGADWARGQLGKPEETDPLQDFAASVGGQYREAIDSGEALYNHIVTRGVTASPFSYDHALIGWALPSGERAILSAITLH